MAGGIACYHLIGLDISGHDTSAGHDGAVSNRYTGKNGAARAEPDIIANYYIAFRSVVFRYACCFFNECRKRKGTDPVGAMEAAKEYLYVAGDRAMAPMRRVEPSDQS